MTSNEQKDGLTPKERSAVQYYTNPASDSYNDWCASCVLANYSTRSKYWKSNAKETHDKPHIKEAIERYRQELRKDMGMTVNLMHDQYTEDRAFARTLKQPSAAVSASVATARLYGMDKDAGIKEDTKPQLKPEEQARLNIIANEYMKRKA